MSGSLDDATVTIIGHDDYEYLLIRSDVATLKFSPNTGMVKADVIAELRHIADTLEAGS